MFFVISVVNSLMRRVLMVFVDGLGVGPDDPAVNPVNEGVCPSLVEAMRLHSAPIDATLGVPGLPQSATGQTSLLTGLNAQQVVGRHVEGFPGPDLRRLIRKHSIYELLKKEGLSSTFANGYLARTVEDVEKARVKSVTTVASLGAFGRVRTRELLEQRKAVSHDVTRETGAARGYTGELLTPEQGAKDLVGVAAEHNFTLFEFFLTDHAGHRGDMEIAEQVLAKLDQFVAEVFRLAEKEKMLVILTSDHGNVEDLSIHTHTMNPVPFVAYGPGAEELRAKVRALNDITPAVLEYLNAS